MVTAVNGVVAWIKSRGGSLKDRTVEVECAQQDCSLRGTALMSPEVPFRNGMTCNDGGSR